MSKIEDKLTDLDARGSEEFDNAANKRDLHRFILSGALNFKLIFDGWFIHD